MDPIKFAELMSVKVQQYLDTIDKTNTTLVMGEFPAKEPTIAGLVEYLVVESELLPHHLDTMIKDLYAGRQ